MSSRFKALRQARLLRQGEDRYIGQRESEDLRKLIPTQPNWAISSSDAMGNWSYRDEQALGFPAKTLALLPLKQTSAPTEVGYLRTVFGTLQATMCLYAYENRSLKLIPASVVDVANPVGGMTYRQDWALPATLKISPGARLFAGCYVTTGGTANVLYRDHTNNLRAIPIEPTFVSVGSGAGPEELPKVISPDELSISRLRYTNFPTFAFLGADALNFM